MPNYNTVAEQVEAVQWTGTNVEAIIALVGLANLRLSGGNLVVYENPVPLNSYVVKNNDGTFREIADATKIANKYTPAG